MDAHDPVSLTQALIRCPSVTPKEAGALTLLENVLAPYGFEVHRMTFSDVDTPDVENLYARFGTQGPNLCFAGHTDVVPPGKESDWTYPPFGAEIHNGYLYGRGAVDMKGDVACFVAAAIRTIEKKGGLRGSISLLITGDEEGPSVNGTVKVLEWMKDREERIDACIVGEPSNPEQLGDMIKIGRRGSLTGKIVVHGKQGHVAYPQKADNPVPKLARILDRLSNTPLDEGSEDFQPSNLEATIISVPNSAANVIPEEAHATFNVRYNDHWSRKTMEAFLKERCAAEAEAANAKISVSFHGTGDVFLTKPGPLVQCMIDAVKDVTGRVPELSTNGGTSDARFIQEYCPVVEFGLVNKTIHQIDENVEVKDLHRLTEIYERMIEAYFA